MQSFLCDITNWFLHKLCLDANVNRDIYACFSGLSVINSGSVGTTPEPEDMLCSLSAVVWSSLVCWGHFLRKVVITMMHWLTSELHRRLGKFPQRILNLRHDAWGLYNEQTEALRQLHRYHREATKAHALAGMQDVSVLYVLLLRVWFGP